MGGKERGSFRRTAAQLFLEYKFVECELSANEIEILENFDAAFGTVKLITFLGGEIKSKTFEDEPLTRKKLMTWIENNSPWIVHPLEITGPDSVSLKERYGPLPVLTIFVESENEKQLSAAILHLESAAELFAHKIIFTYFVW